MKKIVAISALLASIAAFATSVTSENTFGVLKIADTTSEQLIISVPWEKVGGGDVKITDLVLPKGLYDSTKLYYYDGSNYMAFGVKDGQWQNGELAGGAVYNENQSIARGSALIIVRTKGDEDAAYPVIYLSGQYAAATNSTIAEATSDAPSYTLIAPTVANSSNVDLNTVSDRWSEAKVGDVITYGTTTYNYDGRFWYKETMGDTSISVTGGSSFKPPQKVTTGITIPAGQGAWYIRAKGGTSFTVNW